MCIKGVKGIITVIMVLFFFGWIERMCNGRLAGFSCRQSKHRKLVLQRFSNHSLGWKV